jgi:mono/diheme cytochrome c family protein
MRSRSRRLLLLGAAVVAVPLLLTPAAPAKKAAVTIKVTLTDGAIRLSKKTAPAGKVTFTVRNTGKAKHDFRITTKKTPALARGKSAKLVITFKKAGKFPYRSTQPGDVKKGLKGTFTVTKAPAGGGTNVTAGKTVFATAGCGTCHVFKASGAVGTVGPSLDTSRMSVAGIVGIVTKGKGTMPAQSGILSAQQIKDVADYVFSARSG